MSSLLHQLGLSRALAFQDVYSIDDPDLLSFVPRPAHALLLVFPVSATYERFRAAEDSQRPAYEGKGPDEEVLWFRQTIGNACGLIGLLHAAANGGARAQIAPGSDLARLVAEAVPLGPGPRAELLSRSSALESAHASAASKGDSAPPPAEAAVDLHYVCFVKSERGQLWEMDGRRTGPLPRGQLDEGDDVLSRRALDLGVRSFLQREQEAGGGELRFSLIALGPSFD